MVWTKEKYEQYKKDVESELEGLTAICTGAGYSCSECNPEGLGEEEFNNSSYACDPFFSWSPCEVCGRNLGGDRYPAHARDKDDNIIHFDVCIDCVYYLNYGGLDNLSMLEIEEN